MTHNLYMLQENTKGIILCSGSNQCLISYNNVFSEFMDVLMYITQSVVDVFLNLCFNCFFDFKIGICMIFLFLILFFKSSSFNTTNTYAGAGAPGAGGTSSSPEDDDNNSWRKWVKKHCWKIVVGVVVIGMVCCLY